MIHTLVVKTTNLEVQTCMNTGVWFRYLLIYRIDSLYVCTGEAVRYNCQTERVWRLWVSHRFCLKWMRNGSPCKVTYNML